MKKVPFAKRARSIGAFSAMGFGLGLTCISGDVGNAGRVVCLLTFIVVAFFPGIFEWAPVEGREEK